MGLKIRPTATVRLNMTKLQNKLVGIDSTFNSKKKKKKNQPDYNLQDSYSNSAESSWCARWQECVGGVVAQSSYCNHNVNGPCVSVSAAKVTELKWCRRGFGLLNPNII